MPRFFRLSRVQVGLGLVVLFQLALFADVHYQRWENVIVPLNQPPETAGAGLVIRGNGLGYYAWLRSLLIDGDWDFANEFDDYRVPGDYVPPPTYRTQLGRRANQWSVGPACLWAVTVVPGHYLLKALGDRSPRAADGYSLPYQLLVALASLAMSTLGLCFLYGICRHFARPNLAALAAAFMTLGSTLVYYNTAEVSMAHGIGAAVLAALVWYWLKTYGSPSPWRWFAVGVLVGAAALVRWQLATFAVLPVAEALLRWAEREAPSAERQNSHSPFLRSALGALALPLLSAAGALLAFLPQMIAWRSVYGHWLVEPVPQIAHHWLTPSLWDLLLSQDRSLFYWSPICALAFLGFLLPTRSARAEPLVLLFAAFALQAYALAAVWGKGEYLRDVGNFAGAFLSRAYGMRHLTEAVVVLAPALALLLERAASYPPTRLPGITPLRLVSGVAFVLTLWNLNLVSQYNDRLLPADAGVSPRTILTNTVHAVASDPWTLLVFVEALGLISLVLLWDVGRVGPAAATTTLPEALTPACPAPAVSGRLLASIRWCTFALLVIGTAAPFLWPGPSVGFLYRFYRDSDGHESRYALFIPHNYQADGYYPLVVHGTALGLRKNRWRPPFENRRGTSTYSRQRSRLLRLARLILIDRCTAPASASNEEFSFFSLDLCKMRYLMWGGKEEPVGQR